MSKYNKIILSTAYLAPVQYYTKILKYDNILIEANENFIKQTYRNRCVIYGANGELSLSVPVKKNCPKTKIKDIKIDYETNWQKLHWKSIESAYNSSPFFEFYKDDLIPFYTKKYDYLLDYNLELQNTILEFFGIKAKIQLTKSYLFTEEIDFLDFRELITPKKKYIDNNFNPIEYIQVFNQKHGFLKNLSIIDLIFNEGTNALSLLKKN